MLSNHHNATSKLSKLWRIAVIFLAIVPVAGGLALLAANTETGSAQAGCQTFQETGKTICGRFLEYWQKNGGLPQQGFPISTEIQERSDTDGNVYTVQYFERAVFEKHPEKQPPYDVLLSLLGVFEYKKRYGEAGAPNQTPSAINPFIFKETGKTLGGTFRTYWETHGGLPQQGYPISDEFQEVSALNGKTYTVQYFERAAFESHSENQPPYDVLLSQLGTLQFRHKYPGAAGLAAPTPTPDAFAAMRERPLQLPAVEAGSPCPTNRAEFNIVPSINNDLYTFGTGPVYLTSSSGWGIINPDGVARAMPGEGAYQVKGPWLSKPEYPGPILVRGRQLDGDKTNKVHFEYAQYSHPQEEMRFDEYNDLGSTSVVRPGWHFWNTGILFSGQGCYGLQIDGLSFADTLIFQVVTGP